MKSPQTKEELPGKKAGQEQEEPGYRPGQRPDVERQGERGSPGRGFEQPEIKREHGPSTTQADQVRK